jgi:trk system potassium uptake protein TrkH
MRNRFRYFRSIADYLGIISWIFGLVMLVPLVVELVYGRMAGGTARLYGFGVPSALTLVLGFALKRNLRTDPLDNRRAMMLTALAWIVVSAIGAIPFWIGLRVSYLDAYFETVSGLTTTGITMLTGLDDMPLSILFWRAFIQWLGGLGILAFFLAILYTGGSAHRLFSAESHKVFARRPAPGLFHTLRILWAIYAAATAAIAAALALEGMPVFDAIAHSMTALSTGGYSPHDASIGYYELVGYRHFVLMEYTLIVGMVIGGMNFLTHYRLTRGSLRPLWDTLETRLWWIILGGATALVMLDHLRTFGIEGRDLRDLHDVFRGSLFQVVSIATTTGFATKDIAAPYFPAAAKQVFLLLMVIGGCVGSTGGGIKVLRVGVLLRMVGRQIRRMTYGPATLQPVIVDGEVVDAEELRRIAALVFAWLVLLALGGGVTALFSQHDALASASGMFSALGNIGPCYISAPDITVLAPIIKIVYILGMLAGRLEVIPLLLLFSRRSWR